MLRPKNEREVRKLCRDTFYTCYRESAGLTLNSNGHHKEQRKQLQDVQCWKVKTNQLPMENAAIFNAQINFKKWGLTDISQWVASNRQVLVLSLPGACPHPPLPASSSSPPGTLPLSFCLLSSQDPPFASVTCFLSLCSPDVLLLIPL